jgi:hypothetical protein
MLRANPKMASLTIDLWRTPSQRIAPNTAKTAVAYTTEPS